MSAVAEVLEPQLELTPEEAILVRRGRAALRRSHQEILELGKVLTELKEISRGRFLRIVDEQFGLDRDGAAMFMRLAEHQPFANVGTLLHIPQSPHAMDYLRHLNDQQLEAAISHGEVHPGLSVREAKEVTQRYLGRQVIEHETPETGAAWREVERELHRPRAKYAPPSPPKAAGAQSVSELVYLLKNRRHAVGLSQADMDHKIGWAEGLCSKYEIPHEDEGRKMSLDALFEFCQALKCGIVLVAL